MRELLRELLKRRRHPFAGIAVIIPIILGMLVWGYVGQLLWPEEGDASALGMTVLTLCVWFPSIFLFYAIQSRIIELLRRRIKRWQRERRNEG